MKKVFIQCKFKIPGKGEYICGDYFDCMDVAVRGAFWMIRKIWLSETGDSVEPWFDDGKIRLLQDREIIVIGKYEFLPLRPLN